MAKINIAVYDADEGYRKRFSDYLMAYKSQEMELSVFSETQFLLEGLHAEKYHLLVLGCGHEEVLAFAKELQMPVLVLTEAVQSCVRESVDTKEEQVVYTSKYQSMDIITRQMKLMTERKQLCKDPLLAAAEPEVIGVFSPVKHEMQMFFSMLYAKNAAKHGKTLYINLLEFSGFSELFGETAHDMGDVILQLREQKIRPGYLLDCIYEMESFSYISPFHNPENTKELTETDIHRLLDFLAEYTDYRTVVMDLGAVMEGFAGVLLNCSKICCLGKCGYFYEAQTRQFFTYLEKAAEEEFLERVQRIEIPYQAKAIHGGTNLLEQLDWSEFGDFVRQSKGARID